MKKQILLLAFIVLCLVTQGCSYLNEYNSPGKAVTDQNPQKMAELKEKKEKDFSGPKGIEEIDAVYLGGGTKITRASELDLPPFFKKNIVEADTKAKDFDQLVSILKKYLPYSIEVDYQVKPEFDDKMVLNFQGTVKDLLDKITSYYGLFWEFDTDYVSIARIKRQSYSIIALPGKVNSSMETVNSNTSSSSSTNSVTTSEGTGSQQSKITTDSDLWSDIGKDIKGMLSKDGSVTVNEGAGFVSVVDTPAVHRSVKAYVDYLNEFLSRQVAVSIKVYNLEIDKSTSKGINADAVFSGLDDDYSISLKTITDTASSLSSGVFNAAILDTATGTLGKFSESELLIEALKTQGDVALVTTASGITLNSQDMPIQNVENMGYVAETSVTVEGDTTSTALIPGNLTTGFSVIATPRVLDNGKIILQYSIALSNDAELQEWTAGDSAISTPDYSNKAFSQRVALESGNTLLLGGFEKWEDKDETTRKFFGFNDSGSSVRSILIVAITVNRIEGANI